jgi:hypothetical protein
MPITKSARLFLERAGVYLTCRPPGAVVAAGDFPVHTMRVPEPLPLASQIFNGDPPPDRPITVEPWPHP